MSNLTASANRKGNASPGMSEEQRTPKGQMHNKFQEDDPEDESEDEEGGAKPEKRAGRRKIKIEYIDDKSRRHITFSKRKAGIMKKAYELSTLTGTQVLLLVVSETGLVYTFTTPKLQPLVTKPEGKNLIQACLNAPDVATGNEPSPPQQRTPQQQNVYNDNNGQVENNDQLYPEDRKQHSNPTYNPGLIGYSPAYGGLPSQMPIGVSGQGYMNAAAYQQQYGSQHLYGATTNQYMPQTQANYSSGWGGNGNGQGKFANQNTDKK